MSTIRVLGLLAALLAGSLPAGCGSGGEVLGLSAAEAAQGFLPAEPIPTEKPAVFLIRRADLPSDAGALPVRFVAREGTPFHGGTRGILDVMADLEGPGQLRGALPALGVPHDWPTEVTADVQVGLPDGSVLGGPPMAARFRPVPPPPPATVTLCEPRLLLTGTPACFRILGTRLGGIGDAVTVAFAAITGTPFSGGASSTLVVPGTVTAAGVVEGVVPPEAVTTDAPARVTLHLAGGESPTSAAAIATLAAERKLLADPGMPHDYFGTDVAIDGDTAVVGARLADDPAGNAGAAFVFVRDGDAWVQQQRLLAPDGGDSDQFGTAVAIHGDTIAVGAPFEDASAANGGSVYVFVRAAGAWTLEQTLTVADGAPGDHLGEAVALHGDILVAGAPDENNAGGTDAGAVYVFRRAGGAWMQAQKLLAPVGAGGDRYGQAVAVDAGRLVVGAPGADLAYVHAFDGARWGPGEALTAPGILPGDDFGRAVDVHAGRIIVGAPLGDGAAAGTGVAHVFHQDAAAWGHEQALHGIGGGAGDAFGWSVAIDGERALVGALEADLAAANAGAAWPFTRAGPGAWLPEPALTASDAAASDRFGQAVDLSGCVAIVGAHLDNHATGVDAGAAYLK